MPDCRIRPDPSAQPVRSESSPSPGRSADFFSTVFNAVDTALVVADLTPGARILYINRAAEILIGRSQAEVMKKPIVSLLPHIENVDACMNAPCPGVSICKVIKPNTDTPLIIETKIELVRELSGEVTAQLFILRDITESIAARESLQKSRALLKQSQERLMTAIEVHQLGFFDWDMEADRMISSSWINKSLCGADIGSIDKSIERVHPEDRPQLASVMKAAAESGDAYETEFRTLTPEGHYHWVEVHGRFVFDDAGQPRRLIGTSADISKRRAIQDALVQATREAEASRDEAQRANTAKSAFLANVSHEIRNPLSAILGFLALVKDPEVPGHERERFLKIIERNGVSLLQLLNDLLDLSKIECGKMQIESQDVALHEIIHDVVDLFGEKVRRKGLNLEVDIHPTVPEFARTDGIRLRQILLNVLGNAVKFTEKGGVKIRIASEKLDNGRSVFSARVDDTGIGLSEEQRAKLFSAFTQADKSTSRRYGGSGLGLSLARQIAQAMGGDVAITQSKPDVGTSVEITVTIEDAQPIDEKRTDQAPNISDLALDGLRILVADDSFDGRLLVRTILSRRGADVVMVNSGKEAVKACVHDHFDIVLLDIQMPEMDGYHAAGEIRRTCETPLIALTAHSLEAERSRLENSGFSGFVGKPFAPADLLGTIANYVKTLKPTPFSNERSAPTFFRS